MELPRRFLAVLAASLFVSYLAVAMPLPVVSVYAHDALGADGALAGLAVGVCFLSTIVTRGHAGRLADERGTRPAVRRGLLVYALAGLVCLLATLPWLGHGVGYAVLIAGRLLLGLGESLTLVGMISWGIGYGGPRNSGKVLAIVGAAMYGAFAAGGPLGEWLFRQAGFRGLLAACVLLPLLGLMLFRRLPVLPPTHGRRDAFFGVIGRIWRLGAVVGLQGVGFAAIGAFVALDYLAHGWAYPGYALTVFGGGFVLVRLLCGHLPDRIGGARIAVASLLVEAAGQALLWTASNEAAALLGALCTGLGCSMVFPAMGAEVVRRIAPSQRGVAMGGFAAFQDLAYGLTGPVAGLFVDSRGYPFAFLLGACCAVLGIVMAVLGGRGAAAPAAGG